MSLNHIALCVSQTVIAANAMCYGLRITHLIFHLRMAEGPSGELVSQIFVAVMRWFHLPTEEQNSLWTGVWPGKNPLLVYTAEHLEHPTTPPRKQSLSENISVFMHSCKYNDFNKHTGVETSLSFTNFLS